MRMIPRRSTVAIATLLATTCSAFVPLSLQQRAAATATTTTTSTQTSALPTTLSFDVPSWLVEASSQVDQVTDLTFFTTLSSLLAVDPETLTRVAADLATPWHVEAIAAFAAGNLFFLWLNAPDDYSEAPYEPGTMTYSPEAAADFYASRPLLVAKRILRLALLTSAFNAGILWDWLVLGKWLGDEEYTALKNAEPRRAKTALKLCERLGPTFIKLGQALSIRTDLIPAAYALELRQLQDAVPPFDSEQAYRVIQEELGVSDLSTVFSSLSEKPVASASIGQVYRGTLAESGTDVAVKVQRPGILSEIALDLHVLRILTPIQTILQNAVNGVKTSSRY